MRRTLKKWGRRNVRFGLRYPGWYLRRDTVRGADFYYRWASILNRREMALRAATGASERAEQPLFDVTEAAGFDRFDVSDHSIGRAAVDRCVELFDEALRDGSFEEKLTKEFTTARRIDLFAPENESILRFALCSDVLAPICRYLGTFPILVRPSLWYATNTRDSGKGSQRYHLDQSDNRQVKLFIHLGRVDHHTGPFTVLRADQSMQLFDRLKRDGVIQRRYHPLEDDVVRKALGADLSTVVAGDTYSGVAVDTCRCYHYGSRPPEQGAKPRRMLMLQFASPFSKYMPVVGRHPRELRASKLPSSVGERAGLLLGYSHLARHGVLPSQLTSPEP